MASGWILALDTATRATAVALSGPDGELLQARDDQPRGGRPQHVSKLLELCADVLDRAGRGFEQVDCVAVGTGPGTFTGLRIGVATARGLARAAGVPLVGVSTLHSLALNGVDAVASQDRDAILAVLDARRGEAFVGAWPRDGLGALTPPLLEPAALGPEALAAGLGQAALAPLAIGEGAVEFREVLELSGAFVPDDDSGLHRVTAVNHCRIARELEPGDPGRVQPEYLRLPDAELARRAAGKP
ncbi:MAG TPA: tRNA (adenosine(37)-N6)-threonylcarbamoyltransferase complex dimerization subunit type 1 TsaB [Solirubrobacteraceae bacterium]|nr:tRNA (adenosine(37)-N6)-threonylcarbamoyltransferase complex dimerization subunit type 1 TsaB [Solirubrobacteraceae bacterium]